VLRGFNFCEVTRKILEVKDLFEAIGSLLIAYLIGSIPFGLIFVWFIKRRDIRNENSGRTGGTNVMRSAGFLAGLITGLADFSKAYLAVILARTLTGGDPWIEAFAGLLSVVGHNYSIFLIERKGGGILRRGCNCNVADIGIDNHPNRFIDLVRAWICICFNDFHRVTHNRIVHLSCGPRTWTLGLCCIWNPGRAPTPLGAASQH